MSALIDHYREAERELERADAVVNSDGSLTWEYRHVRATLHIATAQVHATLAHADAVTEASNIGAKAIYDGRI